MLIPRNTARHSDSAGPALNRMLPAGVLVLLAVVIVLVRVHTYDEPLENDVAGYAVIAHEMLQGRSLYSDLWERKPPLLYGVFAAAEMLVGPGRPAVFAVNLFSALASLMAVYAAARLMSSTGGGLFAAAIWALLGGDIYLQANQPNAEALANPLLTAAIALLFTRLILVDEQRFRRWVLVIAIGSLFAAASLIKHHLVAFAAVVLVGYLLAGDRLNWRRRAIDACVVIAIIAFAWGVTIGYFSATHRLQPFLEILVGQNLNYTGNPILNLFQSLKPTSVAAAPLGWIVAPVLLLIGALLLGDRRWRPRAFAVMWVFWVIAAWTAEALPGRSFMHYFQYWIPLWCVTGGVAAAAIFDSSRSIPSLFRYAVVVVAFGFAIIRQVQVLFTPVDQLADIKYPGGNYTQQKYLGRELRRSVLKPGETFWVAGDDVSLYMESGISPPTGLLYVDPLTEGPAIREYNQRLVNDLSAHPPDLILLSPLIERFPKDAPIFRWIGEHYLPWNTSLGGRVYRFIYVRRGSAIQSRLGVDATNRG